MAAVLKPMRMPQFWRSPKAATEGGATFTRRHRLFRALWSLTWLLAARWTPRPLHGWRRRLAVAFGAKLSSSARIYPDVRIWYPPNLEMGEHATLGPGVDCYCMDVIRLGDHALVSQRAFLCAGTHDISDPNFALVTRPIHVEAAAWIAAEAFVGPGVRVGEGAVLGARGVATRDLEAWTVYAGNPARPLKRRKITR